METKESATIRKETGKKYVSEQRRLSSGSAFVRVLIVITWSCIELSFLLTQAQLAYQAAFGAIFYGIPATLLWFTVGNIHKTDTIEWVEQTTQDETED